MYTLLKNNTSPLRTVCTLMSQITTLLTLTLVHTSYEKSTPRSSTKFYWWIVGDSIVIDARAMWVIHRCSCLTTLPHTWPRVEREETIQNLLWSCLAIRDLKKPWTLSGKLSSVTIERRAEFGEWRIWIVVADFNRRSAYDRGVGWTLHYEIKPPIYKKFIEKENKCIRTNCKLKNGVIWLWWDFQFNVINAPLHVLYKI